MKVTLPFFSFLLLTQCTFGQNLTTEDVFKRYLVSEDESTAKMIINSKDNLYSLFCQGALTESLSEKIDLFSQFIKKNPKYGIAKAYLDRGIAYSLANKPDSAIVDLDKSISLDPQKPYSYHFRGVSYADLKNYDKAIADYSSAIKLDPEFKIAYYMRGLSFLNQEIYEKALPEFSKVIELDKTYDKAYYMRGQIFYLQETYEKALPEYSKVIELDETSDQAYLMRGRVYNKMGDYKKAISDWKEVKKLNMGNLKKAEELIEKATEKMKEQK